MKIVNEMAPDELEALESEWCFKARPEQILPLGDWNCWLIQTGRGWGKTRTGAESVIDAVRSGVAKRVHLVARAASDVRDVMVEGESGILSVSPPDFRPEYEPSKRRLTWPNGATATTFSSEQPDQLRGPQGWRAVLNCIARQPLNVILHGVMNSLLGAIPRPGICSFSDSGLGFIPA